MRSAFGDASPNVLAIPAQADVTWPDDAVLTVIQLGAGQTTIDAVTGVNLNGISSGAGAINARRQGVSLVRLTENDWLATGDIGVIA